MKDRHVGYAVTLESNMREDDAQATFDALRQIRGVLDVRPIVSTPEQTAAEARARRDMQEKFYDFYCTTFQWETTRDGSRVR
jgi:hypothetical protein